MTIQEQLDNLRLERKKVEQEYQTLYVVLRDIDAQIEELQNKLSGVVYPGEVYVNKKTGFEYVVVRIANDILLTSSRTGKLMAQTPMIRDDDDKPGAYTAALFKNNSITRVKKKPC